MGKMPGKDLFSDPNVHSLSAKTDPDASYPKIPFCFWADRRIPEVDHTSADATENRLR